MAHNIKMGDDFSLGVSGMSQARDGFTTTNFTGKEFEGRNRSADAKKLKKVVHSRRGSEV